MKRIALIFVLMTPSWAWAANITPYFLNHPITNTETAVLFIEGEIVESDYENYLKQYSVVKTRGALLHTVYLDSKGGLVAEALKIGRHIRTHGIQTEVERGKQCFSSCALIFLAGISRLNAGDVGVHRSYLEAGSKLSFSEMEDVLSSNYDQVKKYLRQLRIGEEIIEDFLGTNSANLTPIKSILERDPIFEEYLINNCGVAPKFYSNNRQKRLKYYDCAQLALESAQSELQK